MKYVIMVLSAIGGAGLALALMIVVSSFISPHTDITFMVGMAAGIGLCLGVVVAERELNKKGP